MRKLNSYPMIFLRCAALAWLVLSAGYVAAQSAAWKPERAVELVVQSGPGGGTDGTARLIQRIWQTRHMVEVPVNVNNKPGGGGSVALSYLKSHAGDGHYLQIASAVLLTSHIAGSSPFNYTDFTPIAQLNSEYVAFAVKSDSPLKSGADLIARLKKDAGSLSIAVGTSVGGANHIAAALVTKAAGGDIKKLRTVVFKSSAESATALLGGHVDLVTSSASLLAPHLAAGTLRLIAIAAPKRGSGILASTPTWREQGLDIVVDNFRNVIGPPGMSDAQVKYWEDKFARLAQTEEWKKDLEANLWQNAYMGSRDSRKYLDAQYAQLKQVAVELGLAK